MERYDEFVEQAPGLWTLDGDWQNTRFRRRMTILRMGAGNLLVHSAIQLKEEDYARLESWGPVAWIVVPNAFHSSDVPAYRERFPSAKILSVAGAAKALSKQVPIDGLIPESWPASLSGEVDCLKFGGQRFLDEVVLFHRPTKTAIFTDLVFNMQESDIAGLERLFFRWNQIDHRLGISRIGRLVFIRDKKAALESVDRILEWKPERLIMNHGKVLQSGALEAIRQGFQTLSSGF